MLRFSNIIYLFFVFVLGCYSGGGHQPLLVLDQGKSRAGADEDTQSPDDPVVYADIKPIFEARCSRCHSAQFAPNWLDCNEAKKYMDRLAARATGDNPTMPLMGSPEAAAILPEERAAFSAWIQDGGICSP